MGGKPKENEREIKIERDTRKVRKQENSTTQITLY